MLMGNRTNLVDLFFAGYPVQILHQLFIVGKHFRSNAICQWHGKDTGAVCTLRFKISMPYDVKDGAVVARIQVVAVVLPVFGIYVYLYMTRPERAANAQSRKFKIWTGIVIMLSGMDDKNLLPVARTQFFGIVKPKSPNEME